MTEIFVSYRTDDSVHASMAISEQLALHFGRPRVFRDRDSLAPGMLYPQRIRRALAAAKTVLAVIGPHWLDSRNADGRRRIDNPADWVRTELRIAFLRQIPVVPVLLDDTPMPDREKLPADIRLLTLSNWWRVRHQSLVADVRGLIEKLDPDAPSVPAQDQQPGNRQLDVAATGQFVGSTRTGNRTIRRNDKKRP